jgi:zinc protease
VATFAPELLEKGLASTWRELRRFHADGLTAEELATFKTTVTGSYKVTLATTEGLAGALLNALQRGYGPEWVDAFPAQVQAITLEQANGAIKTLLDPERMVLVLAGTLPSGLALTFTNRSLRRPHSPLTVTVPWGHGQTTS